MPNHGVMKTWIAILGVLLALLFLAGISTRAQETTFFQKDFYDDGNKEIKKLNKIVSNNEIGQDLLATPYSNVQIGVGARVSSNDIDIYKLYTFITDLEWHRIVYIESEEFEWIKSYGSYGSGNGQFKHPRGIDVNWGNRIYVADTGNNRIAILGFENDQLYFYQNVESNFDNPTDVAWHDGGTYYTDTSDDYLVVCDSHNHRIVRLSISGTYLDEYGSYGNNTGQFAYPTAVATIRHGETHLIYVADNGNNRIVALIWSGGSYTWYKEYEMEDPSDITALEIAIEDSELYATDRRNHRIIKFNKYLQFLTDYGTQGYGYYAQNVFWYPRCMSHWKLHYSEYGGYNYMALYNLFTSEAWTNDAGGQRHTIGVDVLVHNVDVFSNYVLINFTQTSGAYLSLEVVLNDGSYTHVRQLLPGYYSGAERTTMNWDGRNDSGQLVSGQFRFHFHVESPWSWESGQSYYTKDVYSDPFTWTPDPNVILHFTNQAASYGIDDPLADNLSFRSCFADIDNDGDLDLFLISYNTMRSNKLYELENGTYTDITAQAGVGYTGYTYYACFGDYDNDGYLDLFVANKNEYDILYHNNGNNTFTDVTTQAGVAGPGNEISVAAAFADFNYDGLLDIAVVASEEDYYARTFQNVDGQTFIEPPYQGGYLYGNEYAKVFDVHLVDFDQNFQADMLVLREECANVYIHNAVYTSGYWISFDCFPALFDCGDPNSLSLGVSIGDYDFDGDQDVYISNLGWNGYQYVEVSNQFYVNNCYIPGWHIEFVDMAFELGVDDFCPNVSFDIDNHMCDLDNDTDLDIYMIREGQYNVMYQYVEGDTFIDVAYGAGTRGVYPSCYDNYFSTGDVDGDGDLDIFIPNLTAQNILYINDGNDYRYLDIKLEGTKSNRDGTASAVHIKYDWDESVKEQWRWRYDSHGSVTPLHFGLGTCPSVDTITVNWTSGIVQTMYNIAADQAITITEPVPSLTLSTLDYIDNEHELFVCPAGDVEEYPSTVHGELCFTLILIDAGGQPIVNYPTDGIHFELTGTNYYSCNGDTIFAEGVSDENGQVAVAYEFLGGSDDSFCVNAHIDGAPLECNSLVFWLTSADLDGSGKADLSDFCIFGDAYNTCEGHPRYNDFCDYTRDGCVTLSDFSYFGDHYQHECP